MKKTAAQVIAETQGLVQKEATRQENSFDNPIAPVHVRGKSHFMPRTPEMLGRKDFSEVFGKGNYDSDNAGAFTMPVNLGKGVKHAGLDPELQADLLVIKSRLAMLEIVVAVHNQRKSSSGRHAEMVSLTENRWYKNHVAPLAKAFNLADMAAWIPTLNTAWYFTELELPLMLMDKIPQFQMKSRIQNAPGFNDKLMGMLESNTFTEQSNTQGQVVLTAQGISTHASVDEDLNFDTDPAILQEVLNELAMGSKRAVERALVRGDDTAPHMDTDVTDPKDSRKAWKGLEKLALANSANAGYDHGGASYDKTLIDEMLALTGRFGINTSDLVWLHGVRAGHKIRTGAIPEVLSVMAYGASTLKTGEIPPLYGADHLISEYIREDLNASGIYAASSTKTTSTLFNTKRFWMGIRAPLKLWVTPTLADQDRLLGTSKIRCGFAGVAQSSDEKSVVIGYNIQR